MPTHYRGSPGEILALDTFIKLLRAAESLKARLAERDTMGHLTPSQFGALESLYHLGPMRQGEIGAKLLKSGGNITLVVDNLEKQGLVRRERDASDRRAVVASITEAGQALMARLFPGHVGAILAELGALTAEEQRALGQLCRKLGKQEQETSC